MTLGIVKLRLAWMVLIGAMVISVSGCGTFGGAVRGLGSDLDIVGSYITDF